MNSYLIKLDSDYKGRIARGTIFRDKLFNIKKYGILYTNLILERIIYVILDTKILRSSPSIHRRISLFCHFGFSQSDRYIIPPPLYELPRSEAHPYPITNAIGIVKTISRAS